MKEGLSFWNRSCSFSFIYGVSRGFLYICLHFKNQFLYLLLKNRITIFVFLKIHSVKLNHLNQFSNYSNEKNAREISHLLKFYRQNSIERKIPTVVRRILIFILKSPNFTKFHLKIDFKNALETLLQSVGMPLT